MDNHVTKNTHKSWEVVYAIKRVRQLFSKHGVSMIVATVVWRAVQKEYSLQCFMFIDTCTVSNDV